LRTADYAVAVRRAAKIASWVLRMKSAVTLEEAFAELFSKVNEFADKPVGTDDELVERTALNAEFWGIVLRLRHNGVDPNHLVSGWFELYRTFRNETFRANDVYDQKNSVAGRLEWHRHTMMLEGQPPLVTPGMRTDPDARFLHDEVFPTITFGQPQEAPRRPTSAGIQRLRVSEVLNRLLDHREEEDGDRRAESEIAPIVKFAIDLWGDPIMAEVNGDHLLELKRAMPNIPTAFGFSWNVSLYDRWKHVEANGWTFERDGKKCQHKRTSETTLTGGWRLALTTLFEFAIEHRFAPGPVPNFEVKTKKNPPAVERDAFKFEELLQFFGAPAFVGCAGRSRPWTLGEFFYQSFLYWGALICLLCGMRPGEIAQLRCRDIMERYGIPHFRFARFSIEKEEEARLVPQQGGNDGKSESAFRWVAIHWILDRLGIVERRDRIVDDYISKKIETAGGQDKLSPDEFAQIEWEAYEQWLFPDWLVYVKSTGEIKWSHQWSKAFRYGLIKLDMQRFGLSAYSARHSFKGYIDGIRGLSERSRKVLMGHSLKGGDVTLRYGPKFITEEQSAVMQSLSNRELWRLALILIRAKRDAERGKLKVIDAWRNDVRSGDGKFQAALTRRAELYR